MIQNAPGDCKVESNLCISARAGPLNSVFHEHSVARKVVNEMPRCTVKVKPTTDLNIGVK